MSMIRSIRRNIVRNNGMRWKDAQKRRYGNDYYAISKVGARKGHWHDNTLQTFDRKTTGVHIAAREAIRNRLNMHPKARNREKDMTLIAPIAEVENGRNA